MLTSMAINALFFGNDPSSVNQKLLVAVISSTIMVYVASCSFTSDPFTLLLPFHSPTEHLFPMLFRKVNTFRSKTLARFSKAYKKQVVQDLKKTNARKIAPADLKKITDSMQTTPQFGAPDEAMEEAGTSNNASGKVAWGSPAAKKYSVSVLCSIHPLMQVPFSPAC